MNTRKTGDFYEEIVVRFLQNNGIKIIMKNYRCKMGEIDIIGEDRDTLVFFEVKYRKTNSYGTPFDAIDYRKQKQIIKVAKYFISGNKIDKFIRFDAIGITGSDIEWIKNAFSLT